MWLVNTSPVFKVDVGSASLGAATVTITRGDGTALVTAGAATDNADGTYSYTLPAASNNKLDFLRFDWVIGAQTVSTFEEIVGSLLFTVEQARAYKSAGSLAPLSDVVTYPATEISQMRELITDQFEEITQQPWVQRYARLELTGTARAGLDVYSPVVRRSDGAILKGRSPNGITKVLSASVGGTVVNPSDIVVTGSDLYLPAGWYGTSPLNVVVEVEYGPKAVPHEAMQEGLRMVVANLVKSDIPAYAQSFSGEDGSMTFPPGGYVWPPKTWQWIKQHRLVSFA